MHIPEEVTFQWRGRTEVIRFSSVPLIPLFEDHTIDTEQKSEKIVQLRSVFDVKADQETILGIAKKTVADCLVKISFDGTEKMMVNFYPLRKRLCTELARMADVKTEDKLSFIEKYLQKPDEKSTEAMLKSIDLFSPTLVNIARDYKRVESLTIEPSKATDSDTGYRQFLEDAKMAINQLKPLRSIEQGRSR